MKRIISVLLTLCFIILIAGCISSLYGRNECKEDYLSYDAKINNKSVPYYGYEIYGEESDLLDNEYVNKIKESYKFDKDYIYREYLDGVEIVKCNALNNKIRIPEKIKGKNVIKLGGYINTEDFFEPETDIALKSCFLSDSNTIIEEIYIPKTVKEIIKDTFEWIDTLQKINVDKDSPYYSSKNGVLYDKSGKIKLFVPISYNKKRAEWHAFWL